MSKISTQSDSATLYVLITSTLGAMFSLVATWIIVAQEVVHSATRLLANMLRGLRLQERT